MESRVARANASALPISVAAADAGDSPSLPSLPSVREKKVSWSLVVSEIAAVYFHIKFGGEEENYFQCQLSAPPLILL